MVTVAGQRKSKARGRKSVPGFWGTCVNVMWRPVATFDKSVEQRSTCNPVLFGAICVAIGESVSNGVLFLLDGQTVAAAAGLTVGAGILVFVSRLVGLVLFGWWVHVVLRLIGGKARTVGDSISCGGLGSAPAILGVVPVLGSVGGLVGSVIVTVVALSRVHKCHWVWATAATVSPVVLLVGVALGTRFWVMEAFRTPTASMSPSLLPQDHIFVVKLAGPVRRGDAIVFDYPLEPSESFVKRVVGLPGDTIAVNDDGSLRINDWTVPRCFIGPWGEARTASRNQMYLEYLDDGAHLVVQDRTRTRSEGPFEVAAGEYFVMGDNRSNSSDSRSWGLGGRGVPRALVTGHAWLIWLSYDEHGAVQFGRVGQKVHEPALPPGASAELQLALQRCLAERPSEASPPLPQPRVPQRVERN